jgi:hypothetical protein
MTANNPIVIDDSYLKKRLTDLGLVNQDIQFTLADGSSTQFFEADEAGDITINYFNLHSNHYHWKKKGTKYSRHFTRQRLKRPYGDMKYKQETGSPQFPFFTPRVISKFQSAEPIETLFIVEGEFKAYKGYMEGLDIIGIPSIQGYYSPDHKGHMNEDIQAVITGCSVKKVVLIADADILVVHWAEGKDLSARAANFNSAIKSFRESLQLLISNPLELIVFSHILPKFEKENVKGLDDLLCTFTALKDKIISDLHRLHLATDFFRGFILNDVNTDLKKVFKYLGLNSPREFYDVYQEHIEDRPFKYRGKDYKWDEAKQALEEIESEVPYIRVGVKYYKKIYTPLADGETLLNLKEWTRACIESDHGRDYLKKVERFEDWCYVPDHIEYKPVVNGFYNKYHPLKYLPAPGSCDKTLDFVEHIFGEQKELGLDFLQLLYTKPRQILPILCLVSEQRNTGKTTFLNLMTAIYGRNATINRNEDFESQFNSGWAGKLIIAVDETFIDRKKIYERIKSLSTGKTMKVEAKGQDSVDAEFFGKIILCSNNEDSFMPVDGSEIRFWVRKISPFTSEDPHLLTRHLIPEIPAFLQFLLDRQLSTDQKTRMWFRPEDIQTDALSQIVKQNKSWLEKELTEIITEYLLDFDLQEIEFTIGDLQLMLIKNGVRQAQFMLKELLVKKWRLNSSNTSYTKYSYTEAGEKSSVFVKSGKRYTFTRAMFEPLNRQGHRPVESLNKINGTEVLELEPLPF